MRHDRRRQHHLGAEKAGRLPDFIVIGTMKSATTTLFRWLGAVPGVSTPAVKEPNFFSHDAVWDRGLDWYQALFADVCEGDLTGEASVLYTDPKYSPAAAERIAKCLPEVRLVCLLRDPVQRLRSHYRHEVQRSREQRTFLDAIADPNAAYIRRSRYYTALEPFLARFQEDRLMILAMDEAVSPPYAGWYRMLELLGVEAVPPDGRAVNVTSQKEGFSKLGLALWESGWLNRAARASPPPVRRLARRALLTDSPRYRRLLESAEAPIPLDVAESLSREAEQTEAALGHSLGFETR